MEESLEYLEVRVTNDMNEQLVRRFQAVEVDIALSHMHPLKSLGPDGFAACFINSHG
jgi:hypothetical protein